MDIEVSSVIESTLLGLGRGGKYDDMPLAAPVFFNPAASGAYFRADLTPRGTGVSVRLRKDLCVRDRDRSLRQL